jgi:DNA-binding NarL/FixJ family response regulator
MCHSIRLVIVDQDDQFRLATCRFLESIDDVILVGEASEGKEVLALARRSQPDVVLLDLEALQPSELQVVAQVSQQFPHIKIIVLNVPGQEMMVLDALRLGALGHLVKGKAKPDEIVAAIRTVSRNEAVLSPDIVGQILDDIVPQSRQVKGSIQ